MKLINLSEAIFRANSRAQLAEASNLSRQQLSAGAGLFNDDEIFGVFKIQNAANDFNYCAAYKDIALLFYYLQTPQSLPLCFKNLFDDDMNFTLAKLVFNEVLEVKWNGTFVSGMAAQNVLYKHSETQPAQRSHLSHLSAKAIEYVLHLNEPDITAMASRLYCYNTVPVMANDANSFLNLCDTEAFLHIGKKDFLRKELLQNWNLYEPTLTYPWLAWTRNKSQQQFNNKEIYKLYISPDFVSMPHVFAKAARILTRTKAFSFKTGINRHGLLRPDKFVAYFTSYNDLFFAAGQLIPALQNERAQGVPFTAQLDDVGLLSWGVDPAFDKKSERTSWRAFVTEKIAFAIHKAKAEKLAVKDALHFISTNILLQKIDPANWSPL